MNRETFENQWPAVRDSIRNKWSNLTEDDVRQINGRYDQLITRIQQRYGYSREEAEEEIRRWSVDRHARAYGNVRDEDTVREEPSTLSKWLVLAGVPLALLVSYLAYENSKTPDTYSTTPRTVTRENTYASETQSDQLLTQNVRRELMSNDLVTENSRNVRIETSNGIVTISGTVNSNDERDAIIRTAKRVNGIKQVDNQLVVRNNSSF